MQRDREQVLDYLVRLYGGPARLVTIVERLDLSQARIRRALMSLREDRLVSRHRVANSDVGRCKGGSRVYWIPTELRSQFPLFSDFNRF